MVVSRLVVGVTRVGMRLFMERVLIRQEILGRRTSRLD